MSAASAAHRFLVEGLSEIGSERKTPVAYSYSSLEEDFVDPLTKATRLEFGELDFDPDRRGGADKGEPRTDRQGIRGGDPTQ